MENLEVGTQDITRFRGMAGEVICTFLSPFTFLSAFPILVVFGVIGFAASHLHENASFLVIPVYMMVYAAIVGRFALPARDGNFESGFLVDAPDFGSQVEFMF